MSKQRLAVADRPSVFAAIDRERFYQSRRWPVTPLMYDVCEVDGELGSNGRSGSVRKERLRSLGTWLGLLGEYVQKAGTIHHDNPGNVELVTEVVREIAALAVGCLEQQGCPRRSVDHFNMAEAKFTRTMEQVEKTAANPATKQAMIDEEDRQEFKKTPNLKAEAEVLKAEGVRIKAKAEVTAGLEKERLEARDRAKRMIDRWVLNEKITPAQRQGELDRAFAEIDRCAAEQLAESLSDIDKAGTDECNCEVCRLRKLVERVVLGK